MKSVGKQLQDARTAKNWTPELAARETKIKVDRLRDLEKDDYSHFSSPAYARGFVRTYARALGLDEYKILRQLDNKLPDDDTATIVTDSNVGYLPETSMPPRAAHRDYTGLYVVMTLGCGVLLIIAIVLFEAYRVGELPRYFAENSPTSETAAHPLDAAPATNAEAEAPPHALPVDPNDTSHSPRAQPVDLAATAGIDTNTAPVTATNAAPAAAAVASSDDAPIKAVRALPVDPADLAQAAPPAAPALDPNATNAATTVAANDTANAPRALPVDPSELTQTTSPSAPTNAAPAVPATAPDAPDTVVTAPSARQSNTGPVIMPPPAPSIVPAVTATALPADGDPNAAATGTTDPAKRLVLTASQDSFVRVTSLDASDAEKPLYAAVLHSGQSVGFDGHKFSINVGVPSAVDIKLDGVNYGPHSDQDAPETFVVESHQP